MKMQRKELLQELLTITGRASLMVKTFRQLSNEQLNYKSSPEAWSILECIEHLNLYGNFYLPEIEKQMLNRERSMRTEKFKPGFIGNYFANLMQVKDGTVKKKMKSPKDKNPVNSALTTTTIDRFLKQQDRLEQLLADARYVDLTNIKTAISLTPYIRLRLGDTFRFFVYHIERHVLQANKVLRELTGDKTANGFQQKPGRAA